jgi:hypothetical protein
MMVKHELGASAYRIRMQECAIASEALAAQFISSPYDPEAHYATGGKQSTPYRKLRARHATSDHSCGNNLSIGGRWSSDDEDARAPFNPIFKLASGQ